MNVCPRVAMRMECPECGYPYCEAMLLLDTRIPHVPDKPEQTQERAAEEGYRFP